MTHNQYIISLSYVYYNGVCVILVTSWRIIILFIAYTTQWLKWEKNMKQKKELDNKMWMRNKQVQVELNVS